MLRSVTELTTPISRLSTLDYTSIKILSFVYLTLIAFLVQNVPCHNHVSDLLAHKNFLNVPSIFTHDECTQPASDLWNQSTNSGPGHTRFPTINKPQKFHLKNFVPCKNQKKQSALASNRDELSNLAQISLKLMSGG